MADRPGRAGIAARLIVALALVFAAGAQAAAPAPAKSKFTALPAAAAPALELRDMAGKVHRLSDYRGKVVLINFWATWCEPCRDEMPSLQKLRQRMESQAKGSFVVLALNHAENDIRVGTFLRQYPLDFPVLLDPFSEAWRAFKPGLLPASFLVGRDGRLRYRVLGELDWTGAEAQAVVARLLKEG
jgi:cytochrome c biogenesis protein CcmG, thiol:disulfide interchange protein DsbE